MPRPDKAYPSLARLPLPSDLALPGIDYASLVEAAARPRSAGSKRPDFNTLAAALRLAHAVTARRMHGTQPFFYRSVASAGALYPFELYLAVHQADGLPCGVYHYDPLAGHLQPLRQDAVPIIPRVDQAVAATFFITGIFFRSAWKYRSRAYRYVLLDTGHLLENLRLGLAALGLGVSIHFDFDDHQAALLLGLDGRREACLTCVHLTMDAGPADDPAGPLVPLAPQIVAAATVSDREIDYPAILQAHRAGTVPSVHSSVDREAMARNVSTWQPLRGTPSDRGPDFLPVLRQRRSQRNFIPQAVALDDLRCLMRFLVDASGAGLPADQPSVLVPGFLVGADQPLPAGFYLLDAARRRWGMAAEGDFTTAMAEACLDQMWLKNAAVHLLFITDLAVLERNWGARGYRYAMIEAGRLGQQAYLAATALGLGACGIGAMYDREAARILGLTDDGALVYLVGVGPVNKR